MEHNFQIEPKKSKAGLIIGVVSGVAALVGSYFVFIYKDEDGKTYWKKWTGKDDEEGSDDGKDGKGDDGKGDDGKGDGAVVNPANISSSDFPLELNSRNKAVVLMQIVLKHRFGQDVSVDGKFGDQVRKALINKFYFLFGSSKSPIEAKAYLSLPFTKMQVSQTAWAAMVKGVDFNKVFAQMPDYKKVYNQYQNFNG